MAGSSFSRNCVERCCPPYPCLTTIYSRYQGLRGLPNYGLSCCVNALLQSFSATRELSGLLDCWSVDVFRDEEKAKNVPVQLKNTLKAMQSDRFQPDSHKRFLHCLDRNHIPMSVQHDADEVFISILNLIQEQMSDAQLAQRIKGLYLVNLEEYLQCNECTYIQSGGTYLLSLPLPVLSSSNTLEECFQAFFELQDLDYEDKCFCDRCGVKTPSKQGFKLIRLPPVVCVHLKRFRYHEGYTKKLHCKVSFPQALDFESILGQGLISQSCEQKQSEWRYDLYAVIVHSGSAMFGHYTAYIKNDGGIWYYANDSCVYKTTWSNVEGTFGGCKGSDTAYMLLYRRTEDREPECSG